MRTNPRTRAEKVGAVGFSMGGYRALVLAAEGKVQGGVSYYGAITGGGKNLDLKYPFKAVFTKNSSPVLILHGTDDETVPVERAEELAAILSQRKVPYEIKIYKGAQHGFDRETGRKGKGTLIESSTYNPSATRDSWDRTLKFFDKYLK